MKKMMNHLLSEKWNLIGNKEHLPIKSFGIQKSIVLSSFLPTNYYLYSLFIACTSSPSVSFASP